jgi:hypothetical protein
MTTDSPQVRYPPKLDSGPDVVVLVNYGGNLFFEVVPATGWMKHKGWWLFFNEDKLVAQFKEHQLESIQRRS